MFYPDWEWCSTSPVGPIVSTLTKINERFCKFVMFVWGFCIFWHNILHFNSLSEGTLYFDDILHTLQKSVPVFTAYLSDIFTLHHFVWVYRISSWHSSCGVCRSLWPRSIDGSCRRSRWLLSPSGDLGIGLVWDNPTGPDPAAFWSDCWNPLQTELNYLWWVLSCS